MSDTERTEVVEDTEHTHTAPHGVESGERSESHHTLKYHLLGPSLTKAGQDKVDQQKVSEIIYNASKGSKFFNNEVARDQLLTEKIQRILAHKRKLDNQDLSFSTRRADNYIAELELHRDISQTIVHIDCDAFFAAVEELERPELREIPMAVGKGVLTTCNYHARKFGCRSGMAGFVAKKLCPDLVCLPINHEKYNAKAKEIRTILANYDPEFESASIDEAYLNITQYCTVNEIKPQDAVQKLRGEISSQTGVTVSAGIAANSKIAKITSNWNKPNGQYYVANDRTGILKFMDTIPVRKVNGVGRVFERELDAIGIKTCGDIYPSRGLLAPLFGQKAFQFLIQCYLGLGRTQTEPAGSSPRKSVGTEHTFPELCGLDGLQKQLQVTATELEEDLRRAEVKGRTIVLRVKRHTFEVISRQTALPRPIFLSGDLYKYSLPLLTKLYKEDPGMKIRLLGLRCANLVSTKKRAFDFFNGGRFGGRLTTTSSDASKENILSPDEEFEAAALQEQIDDIESLEKLSQELESSRSEEESGGLNNKHEEGVTPPITNSEQWICPICSIAQQVDYTLFNQHVDFCLSRDTIKEAVNGTLKLEERPPGHLKKRKMAPDSYATKDGTPKRPFFG